MPLSLSLSHVLHGLPAELDKLSRVYPKAAAAHPLFTEHPNLSSLLTALDRKQGLPLESRKALIASVLQAHQKSPHALWSTVLSLVFRGLVLRLRKTLRGGDQETRDSVLAEALMDAFVHARSDDPPRVFMYVRQQLRRRTFRALKEQFAWQAIGFGVEADEIADPRTEATRLGHSFSAILCRSEDPELLTTLTDPSALRALAEARSADAGDAGETARVYQRLHKRRHGMVRDLRQRLLAPRGARPLAKAVTA